MARKALDTGKSFTYAGDKGDVETNAKKADDNFVELYTSVAALDPSGIRRFGITAPEQLAPADTSVESTHAGLTLDVMEAGGRLVIKGWGKVTNQNGANTFTPKLYLGGTVMATMTAFDPATNDRVWFDVELFIEDTAGDILTFNSRGQMAKSGGTVTETYVEASANEANPSDVIFTQQWSANSASNRFKLFELSAIYYPPEAA